MFPDQIDELDGLRGLAALVVVLHHIAQSFPGAPNSALLRVWLAATHSGWIGVDIFFALSGFLITRVLIRSRPKPHYYRNFYMRRVLRLAAPYFLILALVALLIPHSLPFLALSVVYLANFAQPLGVDMAYGPLWSLAVEEHFYLVWPWLIRYLRLRTLFVLAFTLCLLIPLLRLVAQWKGFYNPYVSWFRFDGLLWGAQLALLTQAARASRARVLRWSVVVGAVGTVLYLGGVCLGAMGRNSIIGSTLVFGVVAMMTTGLIGIAVTGAAPALLSPLRAPVARFFGNISYWVYLVHELMLIAALKLVRGWPPGCATYFTITALVLLGCTVTGILVRRWIELPLLSLKRRYR